MLRSLNNQLFAMESTALEGLFDRLAAIDPKLIAQIKVEAAVSTGPAYDIAGSTAKIYISGALLRSTQDAQLFRAYGEEATSYSEIMSAVAAAEADPSVKSVLFVVDSPGGQVSGIHDASDAIAGMKKPATAHVETLCASAAYWLASQADNITASRGANIGSIGAYMAIADYSAAAAQAGVKVHVVSSGPHKGAGVPGAEINADQLAEFQARINATAQEFISDVSKGRGISPEQIKESADGRVYSSTDAVSRGLIDSIASDPLKDFKMADILADIAALVKAHPEHAALIATDMAAGAKVDAVLAKIEAGKVAAQIEAANKGRDEAVKAAADLGESIKAKDAKIAELEKALADEKAAAETLKALGAGAKAANKVQPDPAKQAGETKSQDELNAMSGIERAKFFKAGGQIRPD